jgi:N utilization substance protein B
VGTHTKDNRLVVKRRMARQSAMQAIYQWQITQMPEDQVMATFKQLRPLDDRIDEKYFEDLLNGVLLNYKKLDELIAPYIVKSTYHLGEVEKAIFRVAAYELQFLPKEVNAAVVISEAVDMAKNYTADKSYTFVNGVLDNLNKHLSNK